MAELNKAKIEKAAKKIESEGLGVELDTENKSCVRAVARFKAATSMYTGVSGEDIADSLVEIFYKGAKFQASWIETMTNHCPVLLNKMQKLLDAPSPRGRRKKESSVVQDVPPGIPDPDSMIAPFEW